MSKKNKVAKKAAAQKPVKVASVKKSNVQFKSFTFGATIPTQAFGNVQPSITVEAPSYEEARDFAVPRIEEFYARFAEVKPTFLGKIEVKEKVVMTAGSGGFTGRPVSTPAAQTAPVASPASEATAVPTKAKSEPVVKAEKAISLAMTEDALITIQAQVDKSVKIAEEDKPDLTIQILKRRNEFKK